jgi:hypothetical protein
MCLHLLAAVNRKARRNSFQAPRKPQIATMMSVGRVSGAKIVAKMRNGFAPSSAADVHQLVRQYVVGALEQQQEKGRARAAYGR